MKALPRHRVASAGSQGERDGQPPWSPQPRHQAWHSRAWSLHPREWGVCGHRRGTRHACKDASPQQVQSREPGAAECPERRTGQCSTGPPVQTLGCHGPPAAAPSVWTPCRPPGALGQGTAPPRASRWVSPGPGTGSSTLARGPRDSLHTVPTVRLGQKTPYSVVSLNTHRAPSKGRCF